MSATQEHVEFRIKSSGALEYVETTYLAHSTTVVNRIASYNFPSLFDGVQHYVAATRDQNGTVALYIDGVSQATQLCKDKQGSIVCSSI